MTPIAGTQYQERAGRVVVFVNPLYWFALAVEFDLARDGMAPLSRILAETVGRQQGWLK